MDPELIRYKPIGLIHSGHRQAEKTPIQPVFAQGCSGRVEVFPEFAAGLDDVDGFSHVYLIYHFDRAAVAKLKVKPFLTVRFHGHPPGSGAGAHA